MSSDAKYPYTLSYKLPNGQEFIIDVETDGEAEDAFDTMFATCGPDIEYSIDEWLEASMSTDVIFGIWLTIPFFILALAVMFDKGK